MSALLPAVEIETAASPGAAVIWMHGLGADGHDFEPIVPALGLPPSLTVRFVFPHAPRRPVTINAGMVMRAWYDVALGPEEDEAGIRAAQRRVEALVEREGRRGIPAERVVLAGFSQGGVMALQTGLRYPERMAGILALSCYLPLPGTLAGEAAPANRDVPLFLAHGLHDDLVPLTRGRQARDRLRGLGYPVEWHEYPMPHAVCAEEIEVVGVWLRGLLS